jgi:hypothetical protein
MMNAVILRTAGTLCWNKESRIPATGAEWILAALAVQWPCGLRMRLRIGSAVTFSNFHTFYNNNEVDMKTSAEVRFLVSFFIIFYSLSLIVQIDGTKTRRLPSGP